MEKIYIYDFDGTSVDTLDLERGKAQYKAKTGEDWPFKGWWGRKESLDKSIFEFKHSDYVFDIHKKALVEETLHILLTGRRTNLKELVMSICEDIGFKFDRYDLCFGSDTLTFKIKMLDSYLEEFPTVKTVVMFEDREEHIPHFKEWAEKKGIELELHVINLKPKSQTTMEILNGAFDFLETPEGQKSMDEFAAKLKIQNQIEDGRFKKLEKYIDVNGFDKVMDTLLEMHDEEYIDKMWKKHIEPHPNNLLRLVLNYIQNNFSPVYNTGVNEDNPFIAGEWFYKGYLFQLSVGQGSFWEISKKDGQEYKKFLHI